MGFKYYWAALKLLLKRDIPFHVFLFVLCEKPDAVCGHRGSYALTDIAEGSDIYYLGNSFKKVVAGSDANITDLSHRSISSRRIHRSSSGRLATLELHRGEPEPYYRQLSYQEWSERFKIEVEFVRKLVQEHSRE